MRLLLLLCLLFLYSNGKLIGKFGSVKVFFNPLNPSTKAASTWPSGIELLNNLQSSVGINSDTSTALNYIKKKGIFSQYSNIKNSNKKIVPQISRRIFSWQGDHLLVSYNVTLMQESGISSYLFPPIEWLTLAGAVVKLAGEDYVSPVPVKSTIPDSSGVENVKINGGKGVVDIVVNRKKAENILGVFRSMGFQRQDIYRTLDKGPWIFSFDVSQALPKLYNDLSKECGLNHTETVHLISHCPYLIAQYARYKGRDVYSTLAVLREVGHSSQMLMNDILRFPMILATPPERIRNWVLLLNHYNVALNSNFVKVLHKAPFMYTHDPPTISLFDEESSFVTRQEDQQNILDVGNTDKVLTSAKDVLDLIYSLRISDMDKLIRTCPSILVVSPHEIYQRCKFLYSLFIETTLSHSNNSSAIVDDDFNNIFSADPPIPSAYRQLDNKDIHSLFLDTVDVSAENREKVHKMFSNIIESYPAVLTYSLAQMRSSANALRASGLRRIDVVHIIRVYPVILGKSATHIRDIISSLRYHCGLRKNDLHGFILRYPAVLDCVVTDIEPKIDYLYYSLGGTPSMLKNYPNYLVYNLDTYLRPRCEFLRAMGIEPLFRGLPFLVSASAADIAKVCGVRVEIYNQFAKAFIDMVANKKLEGLQAQDVSNPPSQDAKKNEIDDVINVLK